MPRYANNLENFNEATALTEKYIKKGINKKSILAPKRILNPKQTKIAKKQYTSFQLLSRY